MIPDELKQLRQWCNWKMVGDSKFPIMPDGGVFRSNDKTTFSTYEEAVAGGEQIAFVIQKDDEYTGVDLDNCFDEQGNLRDWAAPIVCRLDGVAYAEISPSGKGIKFLTKAKKQPDAKCVKKFDGGKQQLECYDFNRFWTITQDVYAGNKTIGDGQTAIDWICENHLMDKSGNLAGLILAPAGMSVQLPLSERAQRYVDSVPFPSEGGRNNAAFSLAGHLFAMEDETGRTLTVAEVEDLVGRWNMRGSEPLSSKEIASAVRSASKNGSKRSPKPPLEVNIGCDDKMPPMPRQHLPSDALRPPGMISDIIDYTLETSMYPQPELALAGAIALIATITGRKLTDTYGTRTNVYVIGLAPSGSGKEQARKTNKTLLMMAGADHMIGPERVASSAGLVTQIALSPAILFQLDEMGRMLSTLKNPGKSPHLFNIATVLMQIYGCSDSLWIADAYADIRKTPKIDQPHPVIYGTAVPEGFWESLTAENVTDGLLGRMLPFESAKGYVDPQTPKSLPPPESLVEAVRFWTDMKAGGNLHKAHPQPLLAEYSEAAKARFDSHMLEISQRRKDEDKQSAALWSRSAGKAGKLALIFAASRQPFCENPVVDYEDIDQGIKLSNWITRLIQKQVFEHVSANEQEDRTKKVYRLLATPMTKSQITRRTQWLGRRERSEILETLIEAGLIEFEIEQADGAGAPRTIFKRSTVELS